MKRTLVLLTLGAAYAVTLGGVPGAAWRSRGRFDPLAPRPHAIEKLIVARRYREALPLVTALHENYPREPIVTLWLARVRGELADWSGAADAWEEYLRLSPSPLSACPALPDAYDRLGRVDRAVNAYERCAELDPDDPARHIDLGRAYQRAGREALALACYQRAAALDPDDPTAARLLASIRGAGGATR
jgi:Flp pilus assembly protein TadD